jgi:hypothetical protein
MGWAVAARVGGEGFVGPARDYLYLVSYVSSFLKDFSFLYLI